WTRDWCRSAGRCGRARWLGRPDPRRRGAAMQAPGLAAWIRLSLVPGLGAQGQRRLLSEFGLPSQVFAAGRAALARCVGDELASRIAGNEAAADIDAAIRWAEAP